MDTSTVEGRRADADRGSCVAERTYWHSDAIDVPVPSDAFLASIDGGVVVEVRDVMSHAGHFATAYLRC
jgi:hypothetical protein